jgi:hypothetical protein
MYHSEATSLPDGRVLVSGSDPHTKNPDGTDKFPEGKFSRLYRVSGAHFRRAEFHIEVYIPWYLSSGLMQP